MIEHFKHFKEEREQWKDLIKYIWPNCECGCGKVNYGWWNNLRVNWWIFRQISKGADKEELRQHLLRNHIMQKK